MRVFKRVCALIYLLSAIVVLGLVTGLTYGPFTARFERLLDHPVAQVVLAVCLVALALGALITVEAIAFTEDGLTELAKRIQKSIERACDETLGASGATALVRFLPAKTTVVTKEVSRER